MGSYQVLGRPEGTSAYKRDPLADLISQFSAGSRQGIFQQAAKQEGLEQEYEIDPTTGEMKIKYKTPGERSFDQVLQDAISGKIKWEDVVTKFPSKGKDKIEKIRDEYTPSATNPDFKKGTGGMFSRIGSFFSPDQAEINPTTQKVIDNITTQADLKEFLENIDDYKDAGVDTKAVIEYFSKSGEPSINLLSSK